MQQILFSSYLHSSHCSALITAPNSLCVMNTSRTTCISSNQTCVLRHRPVSRPFFLCGMSILLLSPSASSCPSKLCSKGYLSFHPWSFLFTAFSIFFYNFYFICLSSTLFFFRDSFGLSGLLYMFLFFSLQKRLNRGCFVCYSICGHTQNPPLLH